MERNRMSSIHRQPWAGRQTAELVRTEQPLLRAIVPGRDTTHATDPSPEPIDHSRGNTQNATATVTPTMRMRRIPRRRDEVPDSIDFIGVSEGARQYQSPPQAARLRCKRTASPKLGATLHFLNQENSLTMCGRRQRCQDTTPRAATRPPTPI